MVPRDAVHVEPRNSGTVREVRPLRYHAGEAIEQVRRPANIKCAGKCEEVRIGDAPHLASAAGAILFCAPSQLRASARNIPQVLTASPLAMGFHSIFQTLRMGIDFFVAVTTILDLLTQSRKHIGAVIERRGIRHDEEGQEGFILMT